MISGSHGNFGTMNYFMLRHARPLLLREKLFFHTHAREYWPHGVESAKLQLAPVTLRHLRKTDLMHRQIAWIGFYDLTLSKHIARLAAKGGTLVDVGANIGYFSCLWAAARPGNRVYAFEPSPRVFHLLKANIEEAGVCSSVKAYQLVLSKEKKQIQFDPGPEGQSGWGGITNEVGRETILMQADRLDDVMPADLYVEVLKIDTEGADAWVLEGAE